MGTHTRGSLSAACLRIWGEMTKLALEQSPALATESKSSGRRAHEQRELTLVLAFSFIAFWATVFLAHRSTGLVLEYGDNSAYLDVARAILHWNLQKAPMQHFMGFPYFIAGASRLFHLPPGFCLWAIAVVSSAVSVWITAQLFGVVVAAYFALTNFAWIQVSFLGGSEPLSMALGLGALLAFRRGRVSLAAVLGAIAVTVRPLMIFVLVGIGLVLLYRRQWRSLAAALGIGLGVGLVYAMPLYRYFGDPLLTVHTYTTRDYGAVRIVGPHGRLFGWPFHGIVAGTLAYPAPWTNLVLSFFWIGLVLAGIAMMFSSRFRRYGREHPNEVVFCGLYLLAVFSYDYLIWARSNFIRFSIPALPFVFLSLLPLLPRSRWFVWSLCLVSALLAALSAVGWRTVAGVH